MKKSPQDQKTSVQQATNKKAIDKKKKESEMVDQTSVESFPASDPPSWTPVTGEKEPKSAK